MDTITQGHARAPSHAPCLLEPLERLKMKFVTAMRQILLLTKAKLHRLLCFCRVAREYWLPSLIFFFKVSEFHIKTSYSTCTRRSEACSFGSFVPKLISQGNVPSLSQMPGSPFPISLHAWHGMREQELQLGHNYKLVYWLAGSYKQWLIAKFCLSCSRWGTNFGLSLLSSHRLS